MMQKLYQAFSNLSWWFKGHVCTQESEVVDDVGTTLSQLSTKLMDVTKFQSVLPFTLGVFSGTLIAAFLCLALQSIDNEVALVIREPAAKADTLKVSVVAPHMREAD